MLHFLHQIYRKGNHLVEEPGAVKYVRNLNYSYAIFSPRHCRDERASNSMHRETSSRYLVGNDWNQEDSLFSRFQQKQRWLARSTFDCIFFLVRKTSSGSVSRITGHIQVEGPIPPNLTRHQAGE